MSWSTMNRSKQRVQIIIIITRMFILAIGVLFGAQFADSCLEEERIGLLHLKSYFKSHYHPRSSDDTPFEKTWFKSGDQGYNCCAWQRVHCNPSTGRMMYLFLDDLVYSDEGYNDTKPWLFNLTLFRPFTQLIHLDLTWNNINGLMEHDGISQLRHLHSLELSFNNLQNSIKGLCGLRSLRMLDIQNNFLSFSMPPCLSNLTSLKTLELQNSQLNGQFPFWLANLTLLEQLDLSYNSFEGQLFLSSLSNLSMLHDLVLDNSGLEIQTEDSLWAPTFQLQMLTLGDCNLNKPHGTIPTFLTHQYNLTIVDLSNNSLTGSFPSWLLINNPQLELLDLENNYFTGALLLPNFIQPSLTSLDISNNHYQGEVLDNISSIFPNLEYLNISTNRFEGHLPPSIAHMRNLDTLDVSSNEFSAELPKALFTHCYSLQMLIVSDNRLQGEIIPEYMNLTQLKVLKASNNSFDGTINVSLMRSSKIGYLDISNNNIMGHLPRWIGNLSGLQVLSTSNNSLHGLISRGICELRLIHLDLSHNEFTGPLPQCSNFSSLITLSLSNNKFTGLIANSLSSCPSLREIDLRDNLFSGDIPSWIYKSSSLRVLQLEGNKLHDHISHKICQLVNIDILNLSRNQLYGQLPMCFRTMSFGMGKHSTYMSEEYEISISRTDVYDAITEYIRDEVEVLAKKQYYSYAGGDHLVMSALDLSCNNLSGVIPPELGKLRHIKSLNLSYNNLSGSIPNNFSNLKEVESLDLSYNQITGMIPPQLTELNFLAVFNVSFNNLSGITPDTGQFATFDESSYIGNPEICVPVANTSCRQIDIFATSSKQTGRKRRGNNISHRGFLVVLWCDLFHCIFGDNNCPCHQSLLAQSMV